MAAVSVAPARRTILASVSVPSDSVKGRSYDVRAWSDRTLTCNCPAGGFGRTCKHLGKAALQLKLAIQRQRIEQAIHAEYVERVERMGGPAAHERAVRAAEIMRLVQDEAASERAWRQEQGR